MGTIEMQHHFLVFVTFFLVSCFKEALMFYACLSLLVFSFNCEQLWSYSQMASACGLKPLWVACLVEFSTVSSSSLAASFIAWTSVTTLCSHLLFWLSLCFIVSPYWLLSIGQRRVSWIGCKGQADEQRQKTLLVVACYCSHILRKSRLGFDCS